MEDIGFFAMMDDIVADGLNVSLEEYRDTIGNCTYWETLYIVSVFLGEHSKKYENAKEVFNNRREYVNS